MKSKNYLLILGIFLSVNIIPLKNVLAVWETCSEQQWAIVDGCCGADDGHAMCFNDDSGSHYACAGDIPDPPVVVTDLNMITWHPLVSCAAVSGDSTSAGSIAELDFLPGHQNIPGGPQYGGEFIGGYCHFSCTGTGSSCPATEPFVFDTLSNSGELLECEQTNFTGDSSACYTLADQTCDQTTYHSNNNTNGGSGHIIDPNMPPPPPPPPWITFPNPGVSIFDFSPESYDDHDLVIPPYCNFTCTGHGQVCPSGFTQTSSENELLSCEDLTFASLPVTWDHCEQIAQQTCLNTSPGDDQPFWLLWNEASTALQFNSVIGPQGESLDAVQYFNNMAVQQLIDRNKNTVAPAKK